MRVDCIELPRNLLQYDAKSTKSQSGDKAQQDLNTNLLWRMEAVIIESGVPVRLAGSS